MKTPKEIEKLANKEYLPNNEQGLRESHQYQIEINKEFQREGFVAGYNQCQQDNINNKYTEEDLKKAIEETIKSCNLAQKESYGDLEIDVDKIIQSLNKQ